MKITGSTALYTELAQQHVIMYKLLALQLWPNRTLYRTSSIALYIVKITSSRALYVVKITSSTARCTELAQQHVIQYKLLA